MASPRSSAASEERNRLRLLAWEQRNRQSSRSRDVGHEKVPVFGEPYKVYKEDELSSRIRRMFGSYEDVKSPGPFCTEGSARPPPHRRLPHSSAEGEAGLPSAAVTPGQSQSGRLRAAVRSGLMETWSCPSPGDAEPPARSRSAGHTEADSRRLHGCAAAAAASPTDRTGPPPPHTFPSLSSSTQPCPAVTQRKPTAYVRPMDGPDQEPVLRAGAETPADEAQCVENILKGTGCVSSAPGQKSCDWSSSLSSSLKTQPSCSSSSEATHSSIRETGSSSGCESDSESPAEETDSNQRTPLASGDWQLGNWIRSSQQSTGAEAHGGALVPGSPAHHQQLHAQRSRACGAEDVHPGGTPRPQLTGEVSLVPPARRRQHSLRKRDRSRKLSKPANAGWPGGGVRCGAALTAQTKDSCFTDRPKVKTKAAHGKTNKDVEKKVSIKISLKRTETPSLRGRSAAPEPARCPDRCSCPTRSPAPPGPPPAPPDTGTPSQSSPEPACSRLSRTPVSLLVKVDLSLLSRVPQIHISSVKTPDGDVAAKRTKTSKKHAAPEVDAEGLSVPKRQKLDKSRSCSAAETSNKPAEVKKTRKTSKDSGKPGASGGRTVRRKQEERPRRETRRPSAPRPPPPPPPPPPTVANRPLLRPDLRRRPVRHYIKEAKRLKHQADAEPDKRRKAFSYLEAAMFFVESGIAMETDPDVSASSYTMFSETAELLKFVLKLKTSAESSGPSEKDFLSLCLRCQALLLMAMFRQKHQTALEYSKTLTHYFHTVSPASSSPHRVSDRPHPRPAAVLPPAVQQATVDYVSITSLVLSSHDVWEQAEQLAGGGSGLLSELDAALGPLSLSSGMSSMVRYARQGVHWLRLDSQRG